MLIAKLSQHIKPVFANHLTRYYEKTLPICNPADATHTIMGNHFLNIW